MGMSEQQFQVEVMDQKKMQDLLKDETVKNLIEAFNAGYQKGLDDALDAIDKAYEKDTYIGCVYCGEPKGDSLSCCGENHFEEMEDE
jgi:RNA polymerase-binding transcription factor DksA